MNISLPHNEQELIQLVNLISPDKTTTPRPHSLAKDITELLDYHGITALVADAGGLSGQLSEKLNEELDQYLAKNKALMVANEALKRSELIGLFESFESAGLSNCVLFKGGALAYSIYREPWIRPRADNDCLIDTQDYEAFSKLLESLGYQKRFSIEGKYVSYQSTFSKALVGQCVMNIDLHWRINNRQCLAKSFTVQDLIVDGSTLNSPLQNIKVPCQIDSLLIASLHRLGHHHTQERLIWLHDIHLLATQLGNDDWTTLCRKAKDKQIAAITLDALLICEHFFSTNVPSDVKQALNKAQDEPSKLFLKRDLPEWRYFLGDLKSLQGFTDKFGFVRETLFPSPHYVRQQMQTRSATVGYLKRLARGIRRFT